MEYKDFKKKLTTIMGYCPNNIKGRYSSYLKDRTNNPHYRGGCQ